MTKQCTECGGYCPSKCDDEEFCDFPKFLHQQNNGRVDVDLLRMKIKNQQAVIKALMEKLGIDRFVDPTQNIDYHL